MRWRRALAGALVVVGIGLMSTVGAAQRGGMGMGGGRTGGGGGRAGVSGGAGGTRGGGSGRVGAFGQGARAAPSGSAVAPGLWGGLPGAGLEGGGFTGLPGLGDVTLGGLPPIADGGYGMTIFPQVPFGGDGRDIAILPPVGGLGLRSSIVGALRPGLAGRTTQLPLIGVSQPIVGRLSPADLLGQEIIIRPPLPMGAPSVGRRHDHGPNHGPQDHGQQGHGSPGHGEEHREFAQPRLAPAPQYAFLVRDFDDFRGFVLGLRGITPPLAGRLSPDLVGPLDTLPGGVFDLTKFRVLPMGQRAEFGEPKHEFRFSPRLGRPRHFEPNDRNFDSGRFGHHRVADGDFFYPFYFSDPLCFDFNYPGFFPSIYTYWGWGPGWIYPSQGWYDPVDYDYGYAGGGDALDSFGVRSALDDIREAWLRGDMDEFGAHLSDQAGVQVYFDGTYSYTTSAKDYYAMTLDAMNTTRTTALDFDTPVWLAPDTAYVTGRQTFRDPDGRGRTVYVAYWLQLIDRGWYIVGVGSSPDPLPQQYQDFRTGEGATPVPAY